MLILGNNMEQVAGDNVQQIQGQQVFVGMSYTEVKDICTTLIRSEIASYTQKANEEAQKRFDFILNKLFDALSKINEHFLKRFQEPAIQLATSETLRDFIRSGNEELSDDLIDLLIERMIVQDHTSMQVIIDEARQCLSKLNKNLVDFLAIKAFLMLILSRPRGRFTEILKKVGGLGVNMSKINSLDIAILNQLGCSDDAVTRYNPSIARILSNNYDSFFRNPISNEELIQILKLSPAYEKNPMSMKGTSWGQLMLLVEFFGEAKDCRYKYSSNNTIELYKIGKNNSEISLLITEFERRSVKMTELEIRSCLLSINDSWTNIFNLFEKQYIQTLDIHPVGYYIGLRRLNKQIEENIPFSLFYPQEPDVEGAGEVY